MTLGPASWPAVSLLPLLSALPTVLFALCLPFRLWKLRGASVKVLPNQRGFVKLLIAISLSALQLEHLNLTFSSPDATKFVLFSAAASFAASLCLCHLSFFEHARSVQPSGLIVLYLLASSACDAAQLVKPLIYTNIPVFQPLTIVQLFMRLLLLIAESTSKQSILRDPYRQLPPEQTVGILNRTFFWWINAVLIRGSETILTIDDLPLIDPKLSSEALRLDILQAWDLRVKPENMFTLPRVLVQCLFSPLRAALLPRLSLIVFRYAQPILISKAIRYINGPYMLDDSLETGALIVLMATITYVGMAISMTVYQHRLNRLKIVVRGSLVGLIYSKSLTIQSGIYDDGKAVTLMSSDADSLGTTTEMVHETWARVVEVLLGMTMLAREVGWVWPVPLIIIFFCSRVSRYLAIHLQGKQKNWNVATQMRIAVTSSMLSSVKGLKMLGMSGFIEARVQNLRMQEIDMAAKVRWMMFAYNASANALGIFAPVITLVLFAFLAKLKNSEIDTETAFTTIAILGLVTHPANMIMTIIPQAVASLSSFERIQQYLLESPRSDHRQLLQTENDRCGTGSPAILIEKMTILNPSSSQPILRNIDLNINAGSITICAGPVGSGKTVLSKAIIGEFPVVDGEISVSSKRIGLCAQSPWLPGTTIRDAICGFSSQTDKKWYNEVVRACCLDEDLLALPDGDETLIGSRGLNLSGGQRQRVALARVVYARCDIVILDDSFSALDGKTENSVVENLLGPAGLLTKKMTTTVLLISNATQHFHLANWIIVLGDSQIKAQGTWASLATKTEHLVKSMLKDGQESTDDNAPERNNNIQVQQQRAADAAMDLSRKTGDLKLYNYYFKSIGYTAFCIMIACTALTSFFLTFSQWWLKWWTEAGASETWFYMGGYLLLSLGGWISTNGIMWSTILRIAPQSGAALHQRLLTTIIRAPLSYFATTDTGIILNRFAVLYALWLQPLTSRSFSQDIQLIDKQLPSAISALFVQIFKLLMQLILLLSAQKLMTVTLPFCIAAVYIVQRIYLRTSRQLRYIELESRSAVFSSFLETVEGIATIRAFDWQKEVEDENIWYLDRSQRPFYLLLCLQRWLNIVLELVVAAVAIGVVALGVVLRGTTTGGQIGVALNIVIIANTTLVRLIESWTSLEISLAAIARMQSLEKDTPKEDKPGETLDPSETWPSSGAVEFNNVTVSYNPDAVALRDIDFTISAGQKFVICGRTGSGKSTLLLSLLRLVDTQCGTIKIDGIDLSLVPRSLIRQQCFITVPQDPLVLGHASLRFNLDPSVSLSDEEIVTALQKTGLWVHFTTNTSSNSVNSVGNEAVTDAAVIQDVLDSLVSSLPHMSTGQSQLFSLTRAIIQAQYINRQTSDFFPYHHGVTQTKPILLLDEATSSLDPATESVMHDIINEEFTLKGHTVIVIAHRLSAVAKHMRRGQDVVAWMSNGRIERIGAVDDILGSGIPSG